MLKWKILSPSEIEKMTLSKVEISFDQQYISMRDIDLINSSIAGKFVSTGQVIEVEGFDIKYESLEMPISPDRDDLQDSREVKETKKVSYGIISLMDSTVKERTKIEYSSLTSKLLITIEISKEAAEFSNQGELTINS